MSMASGESFVHPAQPGDPAPGDPTVAGRPRGLVRQILARRLAIPVFAVLALLVLVAVFAPLIAPHNPAAQDLLARLRPPAWLGGGSTDHLLGTDQLGRDVLSRLIVGSRISLLVGVTAAAISGVLGAVIGLTAGYAGGWTDRILMRLTDVQLAFPSILLALAVIGFLGSSVWNVIIVLGVTNWVAYARVIRSEAMSLRERDYVNAARAIGVSGPTIIRRHLLPNVIAPLATIGTLQVGSVILAEAALSFLGLGVPPSSVTWGAMLSDGQLYLGTSWWLAVFPGIALLVTVLAINLAGDVLRDATDPKVARR